MRRRLLDMKEDYRLRDQLHPQRAMLQSMEQSRTKFVIAGPYRVVLSNSSHEA